MVFADLIEDVKPAPNLVSEAIWRLSIGKPALNLLHRDLKILGW